MKRRTSWIHSKKIMPRSYLHNPTDDREKRYSGLYRGMKTMGIPTPKFRSRTNILDIKIWRDRNTDKRIIPLCFADDQVVLVQDKADIIRKLKKECKKVGLEIKF